MRPILPRLVVCTLLVAAFAATGCREQVTSRLTVERVGWDTLRVAADFAREGGLGESEALADDGLEVRVFDADYDTLYAGGGPLVPIPDARLGDREAILVEACLPVDGARVCEQEAVTASPKRVQATVDVAFPQGSDYRRGGYTLDLAVERARFDGTGWERIEAPPSLETYLLASVPGADRSGGDVPLRVPVAPGEGRFDLGRLPGHDDFDYHLRSRLHDAQAAEVRFELHGGLGRETGRLAVASTRVEEKTRADRAADLAVLVEQAAGALVDRLGVFDRARVYVDDWSFDEILNAYTTEIEVVGRSGGFFDRFGRERLRGTLRVREDGTRAVFTLEEATREVESAWRDTIGDPHEDPTLRLDTLTPRWERDEDIRDRPETAAEQF